MQDSFSQQRRTNVPGKTIWVAVEEALTADLADSGCEATFSVLAEYVDRELAGAGVPACFHGIAVHLRCCPACRTDHDGLVEAARTGRSAGGPLPSKIAGRRPL